MSDKRRLHVDSFRGNILPLALIMMLTILMAGIGIGTVVLEGSRRAKAMDASVAAYYMADSGIERQLYEVRKNSQTVSYLNSLGGSYFNGGSWVSTGAYEPIVSKKISTVSTSSFAVIDSFDPDNLGSMPGIASILLSWEKDPSCFEPASNIEVSYAYWEIIGGVPVWPSDNQFVVLPKNGSGVFTIGPLDPNRAYRIRMKAYDCPAVNLEARLFDSAAQPKAFPGDITLGAEGTYSKATQKIAVTMPKLDVLSGLFSYVLFSECTLVKGTGSQECPP
ncbi:MAG: hypothetical protein ABIB04_01780 [Patescibacteria group bacterium]